MHDDEDQPIPPAPEIAAKLRHELTAKVLESVAKYALRRVKFKRRSGVPCFDNEHEAENMATDAATLTILGHRPWSPEVPLVRHLCSVVRSVSSDEVRHQRRAKPRTIQVAPSEDGHDGHAKLDALMVRHGSHRSAWPKRMVSLTDARDRLLAPLRVLSHNDPHVRRLLDAYEDGCDDPVEAREHAGLSRDEMRFARRRLDRMLEELPKKIEEGAQDALEVSYGY